MMSSTLKQALPRPCSWVKEQEALAWKKSARSEGEKGLFDRTPQLASLQEFPGFPSNRIQTIHLC